MSKPSIPQGTRDFSPEIMSRRKFILQTIENVYERFGFMPLETPALENLSTLTGKYGSEGDQLLFKVLNNGDFLKDIDLSSVQSRELASKIADRGLRYDLTVPLARFVVMHRHEISLPFKRYQMQPVWRADRPQKGRYREFWQCDADVVGTDSLLPEADFIRIYKDVFSRLGIENYSIRINHRRLLEACTEKAGVQHLFREITIIIDKTDKIGADGVKRELLAIGMNESQAETILGLLHKRLLSTETLSTIATELEGSPSLEKALSDLGKLIDLCGDSCKDVVLDGSLARGLDYYTGCIFEVVPEGVQLGSISGGGRYDNLTAVFGSKEKLPGVGISFGIDRIYDLMNELGLFGENIKAYSDVIICPMDEDSFSLAVKTATLLREAGFRTEVYPDASKLKKQLDYANAKRASYAVIIGENERNSGCPVLKDLRSGEQVSLKPEDIGKNLYL